VEYNREKGIVFLLNRERPAESLRLVTVKLKLEHLGDSESEDLDSPKHSKEKHRALVNPKFDFVKEVQLKVSKQLQMLISKVGEATKPKFMKIMYSEKGNEKYFYIYVSIAGEVPVYCRTFS